MNSFLDSDISTGTYSTASQAKAEPRAFLKVRTVQISTLQFGFIFPYATTYLEELRHLTT